MSLFSFVDASGRVLEKKYSGPDEYLSANTPSGCIAIRADLDPRRQRVIWVDDGIGGEASHVVVNIRPARPDYAADGLQWQWSDEADDWVGAPTRAALMQQLRAERDARLAASDVLALRALEALLPAELQAYRQAMRDAPQVAEAAADVSPLAVVLPAPPDLAGGDH